MLKFKLDFNTVTEEVKFKILEQDESLRSDDWDDTEIFEDANTGWVIKSSNVPELNFFERIIYLRGTNEEKDKCYSFITPSDQGYISWEDAWSDNDINIKEEFENILKTFRNWSVEMNLDFKYEPISGIYYFEEDNEHNYI